MHDRLGPARHAIEPRRAPRAAAHAEFLGRAAAQLSAWAQEGLYDELVLCAPPRAAGILKTCLDEVATKRLKTLVLKDLIHERADEIAARMKAGFE
jgi:protein required for attachment to host cells